MFSLTFKHRRLVLPLFFLIACSASIAWAQTTEFTYQGKLVDNSIPANTNYDFEFQLYAAPMGGAPIGTRILLGVPVTNGVFTVRLDFSPAAFNGSDRFLEIAVKPAGNPGGYQQLLPRQQITYAPYSFRSLNATNADTATTAEDSLQLGGIAANLFVLTGDGRLTDARIPLAGSDDYLQNRTTQQASTNFNISGNGTLAGTLSATGAINTFGQYNIGNNRVLSIAGTDNTFVGLNAGTNNTSFGNTFVGRNAGNANTGGFDNSFFGSNAGANASSGGNSFFGAFAGENVNGPLNSFFGKASGFSTTSGTRNVFVGNSAGSDNTVGDDNTIIGNEANVGLVNLSFATAIGASSTVSTSNTIALGRSDGSDFVLIPGLLTLPNLASAGSEHLCRNSFDRVGTCSSSLRYKTNVQTFFGGLDIVNRLRPITFDWKDGGLHDLGLGAEDVEKVEPLLVTYNKDGKVEGVKYDRVAVVLLNAVKEQQAQIKQQAEQIQRQQNEIENLKRLACLRQPKADMCKAAARTVSANKNLPEKERGTYLHPDAFEKVTARSLALQPLRITERGSHWRAAR